MDAGLYIDLCRGEIQIGLQGLIHCLLQGEMSLNIGTLLVEQVGAGHSGQTWIYIKGAGCSHVDGEFIPTGKGNGE